MDLEDQIPDLFVNFILSYNLQFTNSENIVLNALKERTVAKSFTEKILLLFNREGKMSGEGRGGKLIILTNWRNLLQRILCEYSTTNHRHRIPY